MKTTVIGDAILILGDSYHIVPWLGKFDCMVTDPPYLLNTKGGGRFRRSRHIMNHIAEANIDKGFDVNIINPSLHKSVVVFCHNDQIPVVSTYLFNFYDRCVHCAWRKTNPMPVANKNYQAETEPYFHAWNMEAYPLGELKDKKRIVDAPVGKSKYDHPTVKPDVVMDKIMKNVNGSTILDPFAGTGSTGIAALKAGKKFTGIEHNEKFYDIMVQRFQEYHAAVK